VGTQTLKTKQAIGYGKEENDTGGSCSAR